MFTCPSASKSKLSLNQNREKIGDKDIHSSAETRTRFDGSTGFDEVGFEARSLFTSAPMLSILSWMFCCWFEMTLVNIFTTSLLSDVKELHVMVSSTVGCASASNDSKIIGREITANAKAKQHDLDILTAT